MRVESLPCFETPHSLYGVYRATTKFVAPGYDDPKRKHVVVTDAGQIEEAADFLQKEVDRLRVELEVTTQQAVDRGEPCELSSPTWRVASALKVMLDTLEAIARTNERSVFIFEEVF
jgi:hypothetical protein